MATQEYEYDEDNAIEFIRASLPEEIKNKFSDDDILFVIDCIWDFYEDKGYLDFSKIEDDDEELDIEQLNTYVDKAIKKDGEIELSKEELKFIIKGELDYEASLDIFND